MKVLLTLDFSGERDEFIAATLEQLRALVRDGEVERAALDVKATGDELATVRRLDRDPDVKAMVSLWQPTPMTDAASFPVAGNGRIVGAYGAEEVVQRDYDRTWGEGEVSPGLKCLCLVRRKPGTSHQAYSEHWRLRHGPLALKLQPGFWHYVQNHVVEYLAGAKQDVDGIGELHFRTAEGVNTEMFVDEEAQRLIYEDTDRFMDRRGSTTVPTKEYLVP